MKVFRFSVEAVLCLNVYLGEFLVERVLEGVGRGIVAADAVAVDGVGAANAGAAGGAAEAAVTAHAAAASRDSVFAVRIYM